MVTFVWLLSCLPNIQAQESVHEDWIKRLTSETADGKRLGMEMSDTLSGDLAFEILESCWSEIADPVRPQLLHGFCPALKKTPGINDRFFDIMHMGYYDPNERVRQFATSYLKWLTFTVDIDDPETYERWHNASKGKTATEIAVNECKVFVESLPGKKGADIVAAVKQLNDVGNQIRELHVMRQAAYESGLKEVLTTWIESGSVKESDLKHLTRNLEAGDKYLVNPRKPRQWQTKR